jgi:hypothetical protein
MVDEPLLIGKAEEIFELENVYLFLNVIACFTWKTKLT